MKLTWEQSKVIIAIQSGVWSMPPMHERTRMEYTRYHLEALFNSSNGINSGHVENCLNSAHRIIAQHLYN